MSPTNGSTAARQTGANEASDAGPWEPAVQKIIGFQQLQDDWDGFGASAPTRDLLESAIGLAYVFHENRMEPPNRVVPGVDGSVIFECQYADGTYVEVEVDRPIHAEVMYVEPGKPPQHWTLPTERGQDDEQPLSKPLL